MSELGQSNFNPFNRAIMMTVGTSADTSKAYLRIQESSGLVLDHITVWAENTDPKVRRRLEWISFSLTLSGKRLARS